MAYRIKLSVVDNYRNRIAAIEEVGKNENAKWTTVDGGFLLSMTGSGTSGIIRFRTTNFETFVVLVGVHNYERWCDIKPDLDVNASAKDIIKLYYDGSRPEYQKLWQQSPTADVTTSNKSHIQLTYTIKEGHDLAVDLIYRDGPGGADSAGHAGDGGEEDDPEMPPGLTAEPV